MFISQLFCFKKMSLVSPICRIFSPSFLPNSETSYDFANSKLFGASPESEEASMKDPSPIPIPFPPDGLSFLPRRRSTLKVIFRRPENVKPSAVSKRSRGDAESFQVS